MGYTHITSTHTRSEHLLSNRLYRSGKKSLRSAKRKVSYEE